MQLIKEWTIGESDRPESRLNLSLKTLNDRRFSSSYDTLRAAQQHLPEIVHTLEEIESTDPKVGGESAHGLLSIIKFEIVFALNFMKWVFEKTNILSKYIQKS